MAANIRGYTHNYNFKLINFDVPRWHTLEYENWILVDSLLLSAGIQPIRGVWQNNTLYLAGDRVYDVDTGQIYRALITHTSSPSGTFAEERAAHPDYWALQTYGVPVFRGTWMPGVAYYLGDIVEVDGHAFYLATSTHVSKPTFAEDYPDWQLIFDTPAVPGGIGTANITISPTPPLNPTHGLMWWESDGGLMYIYYNDGDTSQWVIACPQPDTGTFILRAGDAMTGNLGLPTDVLPGPYDAVSKTYVDTSLQNIYSPVNNPVFTGDPQVPTPPPQDNDNSIANTAWVTNELNRLRGATLSTGDVKLTFKTVADTGWVMMDDTSIGSASSGAHYARADSHDLFVLLYSVIPDAYCPVSGGRSGTAEADWTANKYMSLPKVLGRALVAAGQGGGLSARALGGFFGEENHALVSSEMGPHAHGISVTGTTSYENAPHTHGYLRADRSGAQKPQSAGSQPFDTYVDATTGPADQPHAHTISVTGSSDTGTGLLGSGHNNMQPSAFLNVMIKL